MRIDPELAAKFVIWRRQTCGAAALALDLDRLRLAITNMCPGADLSWLLMIAKRLANQKTLKPAKSRLVTSEQLYALGIELMDEAEQSDPIRKLDAFRYRDGLIIALLALIPLRRRSVAALRIGQHLLKSGDLWVIDIPAHDIKTRQAIDYPVSASLSARIDRYLAKFRDVIPGASKHNGLWASNQSRPMDDSAIYDRVQRRTREGLGFPVSLYQFRHAAATFWSIHDPSNVRGVKDLLGHSSFGTTEKHYVDAPEIATVDPLRALDLFARRTVITVVAPSQAAFSTTKPSGTRADGLRACCMALIPCEPTPGRVRTSSEPKIAC